MYRRSLALLWTGFAVFATAATLDAFLDFMKNAQGILIGAAAMFFASAWLRIGLHELNETAILNRAKSEELKEDVEQKTAQVRGDVDQVHCQMGDLNHEVVQLKALVRAKLIKNASEEDRKRRQNEEDRPLATVHTLRLRGPRGKEAIVGRRTRGQVNEQEIWDVLLAENEHGTLPGTGTSPGASS